MSNAKLFECGLRLSAVCAILERMDISQIDKGHKQHFLMHVMNFQRVCRKVGLNGKVYQLATCRYCGKVYTKKKICQQYCNPYCRRNAWLKRQRNARETGKKER